MQPSDFEIGILPPQASTLAPQVDMLNLVITLLTIFFTVAVSAAVLFMIVRFHKTRQFKRDSGHGDHMALELTWTILPTFLALGIFVWSAFIYYEARTVPPDAMQINVIGKQWMWKVQHPNGRREVNNLTVPVGQPISLRMISQDTIHDFYIPAFRVKMDVLPGRYTQLWFEATKPGEYHLFCAEYCGTEHSRMIGKVRVLEPQDYEEWLNSGNLRMARSSSPEHAGEKLFSQLGCVTCHMAGAAQKGPQLAGIVGEEQKLEGGESVVVDEDYIRESILNPNAKTVLGYQRLMPTYKGSVTEEQISNIIAYIKSLDTSEGA